jgi:ribosomal protein L11
MPTSIESLISSDQAAVGDAIDPQLGPTSVDVQPAGIPINDRIATFDGLRIPISLTDGHTHRDSSGVRI